MKDTDRASGFTLVELTTAIGALAVLMASGYGLARGIRQESHRTSGYSDDLLGAQRALALLTQDLRHSTAVESGTEAICLTTPEGEVHYALEGGVLSRRTEGESAPVARRIAGLDVRPEGETFALSLTLAARSARATADDATSPGHLSTRVRPRVAAPAPVTPPQEIVR